MSLPCLAPLIQYSKPRQEPQRHRKTDYIVQVPVAEDSCAINNSAIGIAEAAFSVDALRPWICDSSVLEIHLGTGVYEMQSLPSSGERRMMGTIEDGCSYRNTIRDRTISYVCLGQYQESFW